MSRPSYSAIASTLALGLAAAASYAAVVTGADVKDESLSGRDVRDGSLTERELKVPVLAETDFYLDTVERTGQVVVGGDEAGYVTLTAMTMKLPKVSHVLATATVGFVNDGSKPATVEYRVLLDGEVHHDFGLVDGAGVGNRGLSPISISCNAVPAGKHTVELQVLVDQDAAGSVSFGDRTMELAGFRLIPNPP